MSLPENYSHVGIAMQENNQWFVVEAIPKKGVRKTPLNEFLARNKNKDNNHMQYKIEFGDLDE